VIDRIRKLKSEGKTTYEIMELTETSKSTVEKYVPKKQSEYQPEYVITNLWTEEDTEYIIEYYPTTSVIDMAYQLGMTKNQVTARVNSLMEMGYLERKKNIGYPWTIEEEEYLIENYGRLSIDDVALALGLKKRQISAKLTLLRQSGINVNRRQTAPEKWNDTERQFITDNYHKYTVEEIAELLGKQATVTKSQIARMLQKGLIERKGKGNWKIRKG